MTDVSGFGLLGHLTEMCEGSGVSATLDSARVPHLENIDRYIDEGCTSGGTDRNFDSYGSKVGPLTKRQKALLCDPQTSGGLLVAVAPDGLTAFEEVSAELNLQSFRSNHRGHRPAHHRELMARPSNNLRAIPGVDTLLEAVADCPLPRPLVVAAIRAELRSLRKAGSIPGRDKITATIRQRLDDLALSRLQPVINGTGVVVHTNLGRSPLNPLVTTGFVNLEMDLVTGRRGRAPPTWSGALPSYVGLRLQWLSTTVLPHWCSTCAISPRTKKEVIVSRGELVQIGGGFRLPDILESSGAKLREIGATNHTSMDDYAGAIGPQTGLILKVHRSNFFMKGFVAAPERRELAVLAEKNVCPSWKTLAVVCCFQQGTGPKGIMNRCRGKF